MNIFYTNTNPKICAQEHNDKHCVKMILEYAQLLSTAHRVIDGMEAIEVNNNGRKMTRLRLTNAYKNDILYQATHKNHPSAIWTRRSKKNYSWLAELLYELCVEYTYRYEKIHKTQKIGLTSFLIENHPSEFEYSDWTPPPLAMPEQYRSSDHLLSYQNYLLGEKSHLMTWKNRNQPTWSNL